MSEFNCTAGILNKIIIIQIATEVALAVGKVG